MDVTPRSSALAQWASIVVAPVVYLTNLSLAYALVPPACDSQHDIALHLANGVTLLLMLVALGLAWRARTASPRPPAVADDDVSRDHFLATIGVCVCGLLVLAVAAQWGAQWVLSPCFG